MSSCHAPSFVVCKITCDWEPQWRKKWLLRLLQAIIRSKSLTYLSFNAQRTVHNNTNTLMYLSPASFDLQSYIVCQHVSNEFLKLYIALHCVHCAYVGIHSTQTNIYTREQTLRENVLVHFQTDYKLFGCVRRFKLKSQWTNARMKCKNKLKWTKKKENKTFETKQKKRKTHDVL